MTCELTLKLLPAFADDELSVHETYSVEEHLATCSTCESEYAAQGNMLALFSKGETRHAPPAHLSGRIRQRLSEEDSTKSLIGLGLAWFGNRPAMALAASLLLAALGLGNYLSGSPQAVSMKEFMVSAVNDHIRQSLLRQPFGIKTAKASEAKAWLAKNLDAAVAVPNWETEKLKLNGARVCYVKDRVGAQICYGHKGSRVSLYAVNGEDLELPVSMARMYRGKPFHVGALKGYTAVCWKQAGVAYALVANAAELSDDNLLRMAFKTRLGPANGMKPEKS